jgi:alkylation response protein AidB-like acyl-CoA dehydrogenase
MNTQAKSQEEGYARTPADGREEIVRWERAQPSNYYLADDHLRMILEACWGDERLERHRLQLEKFGGEAATIVDAAVRRANEVENLPRLNRFSSSGARIEDVVHSLDHQIAGRYIYGSGAMSVYSEPGNNLLALTLFYLSSQNGEAGHNCPLACTAGVIKTLERATSPELKAKYLPRLLDPVYETRFHGAQFLTEIQGGSDVGANACTATRIGSDDGRWLISGEKWFCSNVTADLALVTARPEGSPGGTRGLGLFLVPRHLDDGKPNGMFIRRLKDKLGTKSLATAEVDFKDAVAWLVEPKIPSEVGTTYLPFQFLMDCVINTSRLYNAVGSAGAARRAYVIASTYANHRHAFGRPIAEFPLVSETLKAMLAETRAITSGSLYLAHLRDLIETGSGAEDDEAFFRFAVNLNKYRSSVSTTNVIRSAIEVLGGNGAMENFSVLPRLLRDSIVFEAWEGAHNTLIAQSLRDVIRHQLHEPFFRKLEAMLEPNDRELDALRHEVGELAKGDELTGSVAFKHIADRLMYLFYKACSTAFRRNLDNQDSA